MEFFFKIIVFLLIFIFTIIYLHNKKNKIQKSQNNKIYRVFIIIKNSSSFKQVKFTKEGELISHQCQGLF